MFDVFKSRLELSGTLIPITTLRIGAGRSLEPIGTDLPVMKDAVGSPFIPGSSFKGAMRSRLESFLRGILGSDRRQVGNSAVEEDWSITAQEMATIKKQAANDQALTRSILEQTDLASHLFGSPWLASKFQVRDLLVHSDHWFGQYQERDSVAIDRDTETAAEGKLYNFQVVPAGTPFEFRAVVENAEPWELGLLMIGLHQFETEQIALGGGRSRGLGVVKLQIDEAWWFDCSNHEPQQLLDYLRRIVQDTEGGKNYYRLSPEQFAAYKQAWTKSLLRYLSQKIPSSATVEAG
jgi:CRISPR-associated RAMP protein (TIGR02581 family)